MFEDMDFSRNKEPTWSERVVFVPKADRVRLLITTHGREAAEERWGRRVVLAVLKAERHQCRVVDRARRQHAKAHPKT